MYETSRVNVEVENRSTFTLRATLHTLGRLSKDVLIEGRQPEVRPFPL